MQAMIKTSRLETGVISLEKKQQPIYDTLAMALGGIFLNAERKHIQVEVNCPETLVVSHDRKWTAEALFNILDNAVKYTPEYGSIRVCVESWEVFIIACIKKSSLSSCVPLASRNSRCLSGGTSCSNKVAFIIFKFAIGVFT